MIKIATITDFIYSIARPALPILATLSYLMGYYWRQLIKLISLELYYLNVIPPVRLDVIASIFLAGVYSNIINSYKDSFDTDKSNDLVKDYVNPVIKYDLKTKDVLSIAIASSILSIIVVLFTTPIVLPFIILGLLIATAYSYFPRLKSYAPLDVISNTLGLFLIPFMMGWFSHSSLDDLPLSTIAGFSLMASSFFTLTAMVDYESDLQNDIKTIAVKLGLKNSALLCIILHSAGMFLSLDFLKKYPHTLIYLLLDLLTYIEMLKNPMPKTVLETIKKIILISIIYVAVMAIYYAWMAKLMAG